LGLGVDDALGATLEFSERDSHPSTRRLVNVGEMQLEYGRISSAMT
jgi:hypothetical protein